MNHVVVGLLWGTKLWIVKGTKQIVTRMTAKMLLHYP
jgi:hypothetical protein